MSKENNDLLYYEAHGSDPEKEWILFIHGAGGSTVTWKRQVEPFKDLYNLLIIDLPGHGRMADRPNQDKTYTFELIATKLWNLIEHLKITSIHLMGVSLGTIIALQMREMHPTKVISVILPGAIIKLNRKLRILANLSLGMAKIIGYHAFYKMSARIMMPRRNHKKSRDVFIRESQFLSIEEFKKWTSMYYNLDKTLKNLFFKKSTIPQLMVMGDQDHLFLEPATEYAKEHDNTQIEIIQKCGHVVSIEKAKQFNTICLKFLSDLEAFVSE